MPTLPDYKPEYGAAKTIEPRVLLTDFGDGYSQRSADGINNNQEEWSLTWKLPIADADILSAFFEARGGHESFDWIPPRESTSRKWTIKNWSRSPWKVNGDSITATFKRTFDLA